MVINRKVPVKVDPKVFFANERTFLAWLHVSTILAGASVAIVAFSAEHTAGPDQLYGVILLPVSISFIVYAMMQCEFVFFDLSCSRSVLMIRSLLFCRCTKGKHDPSQGSRSLW
jgi:uncharacterized membrane protein YidH (DUF202 family)